MEIVGYIVVFVVGVVFEFVFQDGISDFDGEVCNCVNDGEDGFDEYWGVLDLLDGEVVECECNSGGFGGEGRYFVGCGGIGMVQMRVGDVVVLKDRR